MSRDDSSRETRSTRRRRPNINKATRSYITRRPFRFVQATFCSCPPPSSNTNYLLLYPMAPKPASTASKAPAAPATASKAPAKTTAKKAAKKTAVPKAPAKEGDEVKKKRRKARKETYSSYIYKGLLSSSSHLIVICAHGTWYVSPETSPPRYGYIKQSDGHLELFRERHL